MAINLKFDLMGNPEPPSIVLANRNGNKLGQLNVNVESIDISDKFNAASEFSFTLNKYIDGEPTPLWDKVKDFKLVYCPEWDLWFEIKVELDETTETVKTVFCTQLGQAELSQIMVYNIHINEEGDPNWDTNNETYKSTILYDSQNTDASLLHRLLKDKAPHYSIAYVDESIQRIQKTFSFDDTSISDAFNEIAEEIGCLFIYNSNSTKGGKPSRTISVYDLQQKCNDCGHRGEFTDKCPKCGSTNIKYGYGEDTTIFVTSDELATEGIQLVTDVDSVKNCFKLEGGDDLMTATIRNCNPNGSDYIWYFSDNLKEDMSDELVEKLESYDEKYKEYYNNHTSELNETSVNQYNTLVDKYKVYYNTKSTCLNCGHEDYFQEKCPKCNSQNILNGQNLQTIPTEINGYPNLMTAYYNTIDLLLYLESGLMPTPDIETDKTDAKEQIELLTSSTLSPVAVNVKEVKSITETTAKSAVLSMAKVLIKSTYKVDVVDNSSSLSETVYTDNIIGEYKKWTGKLVVTNYSNEEDSATSEIIEVLVGNDAKTFVEQKIEKALNKESTDDYSVIGLFAKEYDDFCAEIKKYALSPLDNFSKACDAIISILAEQGVGDDGSNEDNEIDKATKKELYDALYKPYFEKQQAINKEIAIRESEIAIIEGVWDKSDENNPKCTTDGLQQYIEECQQEIQEALDFEKHLGADLWLEFCAYRREDKYSNSNYVSDGLNNAELFKRANEFIAVAEKEIFKSAELQHSISATLNNLLSLPKFKPLLKSFKTGNWIRVQIDDKVYKLRLLEYGFGYGDSESISVEFSDVTKIKNGVTDVKEVLEQASSIASSYDSVQRQAEKGNVARSTIDQWLVDGLDSADVRIKSNDSEEILLTKSGLLARSYDDITGTYAPEQFKLTHNIMAYTDDNWKTVSAALGKHSYHRWNGSSFVDDEGYGLTSKFVTAGYITGSQIIGGEILSSNYQLGKSGTYLNLIKGDFDFAGGKIVYNADKNRVTLSGVEIQWDSVNTPTIENIDGLSGVTEDIRAIEQGLHATTINGQYVISPHIVGGDLKIIGDNGASAQISNTGVLTATGANITGHITATSLTLGSDVRISTDNIPGLEEYAKKEDIPSIDGTPVLPEDILYADDVVIDSSTSVNGITTQSITVGDKTYTSIISGDFVLTNVGLGEDTEDGSKKYTCISNDGLLTAKNAIIYGTVYATAGEFTGSIKAGSTLYVGEHIDDDGNIFYNTWIDKDGVLNTINANISGEIRAVKGQIGGFTIEPTETNEDESKSGGWLYSGTNIGEDKSIFLSATNMSGTIPFAAEIAQRDENGDVVTDNNGETVFDTVIHEVEKTDWRLTIGNNFGVTSDGTAYMSNCEIIGGSLRIGSENSGYYAYISSEGVLNASGANISGTITAINGAIGGWNINKDSISKNTTRLIASDDVIMSSVLDEGVESPARICVGTTKHTVSYTGEIGEETNFVVEYNTNRNKIGDVAVEITECSDEQSELTITDIKVSSDEGSDEDIIFITLEVGNTEGQYQGADYTLEISYSVVPPFCVLDDGSLYASAANITGTINATDGEIGGWNFNGDGLYSSMNTLDAPNIFLSSTGRSAILGDADTSINNLMIRAGMQFGVTTNGELYAYSGSIGGWDIADKTLTRSVGDEQTNLELGSPKLTLADTIRLSNNGTSPNGRYTYDTYVDFGWVSGSQLVENKVFPYYGLITDSNLGFVVGSDRQGLLSGNWTCQGTWTESNSSSDMRIKNSISNYTSEYDTLFDNLKPRRYKYNNGTSNRYHTGYIAQEVVEAIENAGLTTQDFAGVMLMHPNTEDECWYLRRDEFVSLNTWQIQKLKTRIIELEERVLKLENK